MSKAKVKEVIVLTFAYYHRGQTLPDTIVKMYEEDLSDLDHEKVVRAYDSYRRNAKNRTFPIPAQIREIVQPILTPEFVGRDAVERIRIAIFHYGSTYPDQAREYIGEVGWEVVRGFGGWSNIVNKTDFPYNPGLIAQARQRAIDIATYGEVLSAAGMLDSEGRIKIGETVKIIPMVKDLNQELQRGKNGSDTGGMQSRGSEDRIRENKSDQLHEDQSVSGPSRDVASSGNDVRPRTVQSQDSSSAS